MKLLFIFLITVSLLAEEKPNVLLIITDDQRVDQLDPFMPVVRKEIFDKGIEFSRAYVTTPACLPSRASIMTGLYAKNHKAYDNATTPKVANMFSFLNPNYYQGLVGKYFNTSKGDPIPEFDYWVSFPGGSSRYYNPSLNVNRAKLNHTGYITDLLGNYAINFLDQAGLQSQPFFLVLSFNAPHSPATPDVQDRDLFSDLKFDLPKTFNTVYKGQSPWLMNKKKLSKRKTNRLNNNVRNKWKSLRSVDRAIERVLAKLEEQSKLKDTIIIFISDNGLLIGEHRLLFKDAPYDPSARVPFGIRYDRKILTPKKSNALVANIDIAPTVLNLLGESVPYQMDGVSLVPLFDQETILRTDIFLEGYRKKSNKNFRAVISENYKYLEHVKFDKSNRELYNLLKDPDETQNLTVSSKYAKLATDLRTKIYQFYKK